MFKSPADSWDTWNQVRKSLILIHFERMHSVGSMVVSSHRFQQSDGVAIISGLLCTGEENTILDCAYDLTTSHCNNESAALQCIGMLRDSVAIGVYSQFLPVRLLC